MALHDKPKESPSFRVYVLYDKVYSKDVLTFAYECCKANDGASGGDGQTSQNIEAYREERWLDELAQELTNRTEEIRLEWCTQSRNFRSSVHLRRRV